MSVTNLKMEKAKRVLAQIRAQGCVPELCANWVAFRPAPKGELLLESMELGKELARLLEDEAKAG